MHDCGSPGSAQHDSWNSWALYPDRASLGEGAWSAAHLLAQGPLRWRSGRASPAASRQSRQGWRIRGPSVLSPPSQRQRREGSGQRDASHRATVAKSDWLACPRADLHVRLLVGDCRLSPCRQPALGRFAFCGLDTIPRFSPARCSRQSARPSSAPRRRLLRH